MVQHPQLPRNRALPVRNGGHDHAQDLAQGYCSLQPGKERNGKGGEEEGTKQSGVRERGFLWWVVEGGGEFGYGW